MTLFPVGKQKISQKGVKERDERRATAAAPAAVARAANDALIIGVVIYCLWKLILLYFNKFGKISKTKYSVDILHVRLKDNI